MRLSDLPERCYQLGREYKALINGSSHFVIGTVFRLHEREDYAAVVRAVVKSATVPNHYVLQGLGDTPELRELVEQHHAFTAHEVRFSGDFKV
ncbi:hypothetical protein ACSZOF_20950 [Aeromonas veronii]|uniref:hypothetical protein n=1 Tax=Aeromonas jandaei TaxID=650 RepID=UPI002AA0B0DA|nr:hypothetical protein [Aeromonas jandaei]